MTASDFTAGWPRATQADWEATVRGDLLGTEPDALATPIDDGVAMQSLFLGDAVPLASPSAPAARAAAPGARAAAESAAPMQLALPIFDASQTTRPEGIDWLRVADAGVQQSLAEGEADVVRRLDPTHAVLTLTADPDGARALTTLERTGLPHLVILAVHSAAGEAPARELALTFAALVDTLRGFGADAHPRASALARRLLLPVRVETSVCTQIAKVRAARWLWHSVTTAFEVEPASRLGRVWAGADPLSFSAIDPELNLVRGALQMFAAASADCFAFEPLLHDPVRHPAESTRLAVNQLRLLRHESEVQRVRDAAAGAFAIEALTAQIAHSAWRMLQTIESGGGAHRNGGARDVLAAASARQRVLVGTNRFADPSARVTQAPLDPGQRPAAAYEALRRRSGAQPVDVLVLPFGEAGSARAHTEWAVDLFRLAGLEPRVAARCASMAQAHDVIAERPTAQVVLCCGLDEPGGPFVRGVLGELAHGANGLPLLYATGQAPAGSETWGAVGFLHRDLDAVGTLSGILDRLATG